MSVLANQVYIVSYCSIHMVAYILGAYITKY